MPVQLRMYRMVHTPKVRNVASGCPSVRRRHADRMTPECAESSFARPDGLRSTMDLWRERGEQAEAVTPWSARASAHVTAYELVELAQSRHDPDRVHHLL